MNALEEHIIGKAGDTKFFVAPCGLCQKRQLGYYRCSNGWQCSKYALGIVDSNNTCTIIGYCKQREYAHDKAKGFMELYQSLKESRNVEEKSQNCEIILQRDQII